MTRTQIIDVLRRHGFRDGRCTALSKTGYRKRYSDHFVAFNAQLFTRKERLFKQADHSVGLSDGLRFTWHQGHGAIHVHRNGPVIGFIWPCSIYTPAVVASAKARLRRGAPTQVPQASNAQEEIRKATKR